MRPFHKEQLGKVRTKIVATVGPASSDPAVLKQMVEAGVELIELQIPFSEPIADGPVILHANQKALAAGSTVDRCLELASQLTREFPIPFLFMTYSNLAFVRGIERFVQEVQDAGLRGAIIPDLPFEEADALLAAMREHALEPIFLYSPNTSDARMQAIAERARGFVYCVARKGVTVNTVSTGYIATDMVKSIRQDVLDKIIAGIPVKRLGTPADIASIVSWVASEQSGFATGADFSVNGGLHMG